MTVLKDLADPHPGTPIYIRGFVQALIVAARMGVPTMAAAVLQRAQISEADLKSAGLAEDDLEWAIDLRRREL